MTRRRSALVVALVLSGCVISTEPVPLSDGYDVILELGQRASLDGSGMTVGLQAVEDDRCPIGVVCIWESNARVTLELRDAEYHEVSALLNTDPDQPRELVFGYVRIALAKVEPYPDATVREMPVYRVHLHWSYLPD